LPDNVIQQQPRVSGIQPLFHCYREANSVENRPGRVNAELRTGVSGCVFSECAGQSPLTAQTLGAAGFRSSTDPSSVISGEGFALFLIAAYVQRADDN